LHVQRPAPVSLIGRESQMVDENRESREREMVSEKDADA
jgi:hypothetical protein